MSPQIEKLQAKVDNFLNRKYLRVAEWDELDRLVEKIRCLKRDARKEKERGCGV